MRQADLDTILEKANEIHPTLRWMGVLLDDGYDGAAITAVKDGLSATERFGGGNEQTGSDAISAVVERLRELWS